MTTSSTTPSKQITSEVTSWDGVSAGPGRRGEFAFKLGRREIGHLHGDHAAHFFFPHETWLELYSEGRIGHHPVFPDREGPAARRIEDEDDVRDVIAMMRLNYEDGLARGAASSERSGAASSERSGAASSSPSGAASPGRGR